MFAELADVMYNAFAENIFSMPGSVEAQFSDYTTSAGANLLSIIVAVVGVISVVAGVMGAFMKVFGVMSILDQFEKIGGIGGDGGGMGGFGGGDSGDTIFHQSKDNYLKLIIIGAVLASVNGIFGYVLNLLMRSLFVMAAMIMNPEGAYSLL